MFEKRRDWSVLKTEGKRSRGLLLRDIHIGTIRGEGVPA